jgi:hypothetical protein
MLFSASTSHKLSTTRMEVSDPTATLFAPREPEIEDEVLWAIYRRLVAKGSRSCHRTSKSIVRLNRMESRQFEAIPVIVASVRRKLFPRSFAN